ncbi:lipid transfer-like protein VAS isoform X2 [Punica granatum]|uniref:Lipid transfer-like protein VAS isoform X2 n=1 Tax=Punica granatum TaxID=22663 RepID=A0A6P8CID4_PUNGR|nr:lipid transfer-like protein VAS isoform X2 [Punica granatum]
MEKDISTRANCGIFVLVIALFAAFWAPGKAQVSQSCLNNLGPCLNYLNWTNPPDICCEALKELIKMDSECLCGMISNQGAMQAQFMGINVTQAQELPGRCGQRVNPLACLTTSSPSSRNSNQQESSGVDIRYPPLIKVMMAVALSTTIWIFCFSSKLAC